MRGGGGGGGGGGADVTFFVKWRLYNIQITCMQLQWWCIHCVLHSQAIEWKYEELITYINGNMNTS